MKEADKRARITVAYGGLVLLLSELQKDPEYKSPRRLLFALPKGGEKVPENVKAVRTKDWQRDYLQRLVDANILIKITESGQEFYQTRDMTVIAGLIADHDKYGLRLSKFLFPREAGIPPELDDEGEAEEEEPEEEVEPEKAEEPEAPEQKTLALEMGPRELKRLIQLLNDIIKDREMTLALMRGVLDQYKTVEQLALRDQEERQVDRELPNYMKNRFKDLDDRLSKIEEALNFSGRTQARVEAGIDALSKMVSSLAHNLTLAVPTNLLQELTKRLNSVLGIPEAQTLWGALSAQIRAFEQKGSLRDTLAELRVKIQDLQAVEELALKAIDSTEKIEATDGK